MKLSDYVAYFLEQQGIRHIFLVSGGASIHLVHALADTPGIRYVCLQHEQAAAMAADAYSRVTARLGAALSTSGPGATNMLTGACCAYYDSIPVVYITGQVTTFRLKGNSGVRQLGFQETDTIEIYKPIVKYIVQINDPLDIRFELEKAVYLAKSGRPGPVLIDIPDDIQRMQVVPHKLKCFTPEEKTKKSPRLKSHVLRCIDLCNKAKRPLIIFGWGLRLAKAEREAKRLVHALDFPVAFTWAVADTFLGRRPLLSGTFGTHGTRYGNLAVQNADLLFVVGSRIDTRHTGSLTSEFAKGAKKIIIDIDSNELNKFKRLGIETELLVHADAKEFLYAVNQNIKKFKPKNISDWKQRIKEWKVAFPICPPEYYKQKRANPYVFVKILSQELKRGDVIFADTGCALAWMMQAFDFKPKQRLFHDFNNTAMGYALPASIGACFALKRKHIICVTGDGSLQMNIQELATVIRHQLPVKIFLINNHGYSMIQQTQDQWLGSRYCASTVEGGLAFPDFIKVARAYGFRTTNVVHNKQLRSGIRKGLDSKGPFFCNIEIDSQHRVIPQVLFGKSIGDI